MQQFGILAFPAGHSLSPVIQTAAFKLAGLEARYDFFEVPPAGLADFFQRVHTEKIAGLSVSIPHKVACLNFLDECEVAARQIGAVNTVFWRGGKLRGTNTDFLGALQAIQMKIDPQGKKVVILGGGGAARAVTYALKGVGARIQVLTRELEESVGLQQDFGVAVDVVANLANYRPEILINTTPVGMQGEFEGQSFVPASFFAGCQPFVFDVVYTPKETRLLQLAAAAGCVTLGGLEMLLRQAAEQFRIWTGREVPLEVLRGVV